MFNFKARYINEILWTLVRPDLVRYKETTKLYIIIIIIIITIIIIIIIIIYNIYSTAIGFSPGGSGFKNTYTRILKDTYTRNLRCV